MSTARPLPEAPSAEMTRHIRDSCLCLRAHRAARSLARCFDRAFQPLGLTNGQFSLMMSLNRPSPPNMRSVASLLAMDRTTLTAALKPLKRRGLIASAPDPEDMRSRRITLTAAGQSLLARALPIWQRTHATVQQSLSQSDRSRLRHFLDKLTEHSGERAAQPKGASRSARESGPAR